MKKIIFVLLILSVFFPLAAQSSALSAKRPKSIDKEKAKAAAAKDETPEDEEKKRDTIKYGMASEIGSLLDD